MCLKYCFPTLSLLMLSGIAAQAQEKILLRFPNGQKTLSGNCAFFLHSDASTSLARKALVQSFSLGKAFDPVADTARVADADAFSGNDAYNQSAASGNANPAFAVFLTQLGLSCNGPVTSYYVNGQPKAVLSFNAGMPSGPYTSYYPNGQVMMRTTLDRGMPTGEWIHYYKQGAVFVTGTFNPYPDSLMQNFWETLLFAPEPEIRKLRRQAPGTQTGLTEQGLRSESGKESQALRGLFQYFDRLLLNAPANGLKDGPFRYYYRSGNKQAEMHFNDNLRTGEWTFWDEKGRAMAKLHYRNGELQKVADSSGKEYTVNAYTAYRQEQAKKRTAAPTRGGGPEPAIAVPPAVSGNPATSSSQIFTFVEQMPEAPYDLSQYLSEHIRYPPQALKEGVEGRVVVKVNIDEQGRITDPVVERSAGEELDAEALRVVKTLPNWKPARQGGKPVSVYYRIPVMFKIQ